MLVSDLLHSCANECVAEAAVASIGVRFAAELQAEAEDNGVSVGYLAATCIRRFAREAGERDWRDLLDAVRGQDFPVLSGLQMIVAKRPRERRPRDLRFDKLMPSNAATLEVSCCYAGF
jgi:hypothetical protein